MIQVNRNNENETESDIVLWDMLKSDIIFNWFQSTKIFQ